MQIWIALCTSAASFEDVVDNVFDEEYVRLRPVSDRTESFRPTWTLGVIQHFFSARSRGLDPKRCAALFKHMFVRRPSILTPRPFVFGWSPNDKLQIAKTFATFGKVGLFSAISAPILEANIHFTFFWIYKLVQTHLAVILKLQNRILLFSMFTQHRSAQIL